MGFSFEKNNARKYHVIMLIIACCMLISPQKYNLLGHLWFMWQRVPKEDTVLIFSHLLAEQCLSVCWRINSYKKQLNNIKHIIICILQNSSFSSFINIFTIIKGRLSKYSPESNQLITHLWLSWLFGYGFVPSGRWLI